MNKIIDLVATGSGQDFQVLDHGMKALQDHGLQGRHSPHIFQEDPLYSAPDAVRLDNLRQALQASDSKIIWSVRGGCGTKALLQDLVKMPSPQIPKTLIGFSDVTALLLFATQTWGWQSIHGPTLNYFSANRLLPDIQEMMFSFCQGEKIHVTHGQLLPLNDAAQHVDSLEAPLTGGNMSLLEYSIGTFWQIKTSGHFIFFEDIDEMPYRIAERLNHFEQAGLLKDVAGIFFGDFSHQKAPINEELLTYVLKDFAARQKCPVFCHLKSGHMAENLPIEIGQTALLKRQAGEFSLSQTLLLR